MFISGLVVSTPLLERGDSDEDKYIAFDNAIVYIESVQRMLNTSMNKMENNKSMLKLPGRAGMIITAGGGILLGLSLIPTTFGRSYLSATITGGVAVYGCIMTLGTMAIGTYLTNEETKQAEKVIMGYITYRKSCNELIRKHLNFPLAQHKPGTNEIKEQILPLLEKEKQNLKALKLKV